MLRKGLFFVVLILVTLLLCVRLFYIQILNDDYAARAERNATASEKLYAPRGYVYDRHGELMIGNSPAYDLMVSPYLISNLDTIGLSELIEISPEKIRESLEKAKKYSYFRSSMFMKMLPKEHYAKINTELRKFPGFFA
jgi:penicillin-binding protein 2